MSIGKEKGNYEPQHSPWPWQSCNPVGQCCQFPTYNSSLSCYKWLSRALNFASLMEKEGWLRWHQVVSLPASCLQNMGNLQIICNLHLCFFSLNSTRYDFFKKRCASIRIHFISTEWQRMHTHDFFKIKPSLSLAPYKATEGYNY